MLNFTGTRGRGAQLDHSTSETPQVKPGTHWRQVDCCQNWLQISKVDCRRYGRLCCRYSPLCCQFWQQIGNNLNSTACRGCLCCQCVRSQSDKVDHVEFNFVAAVLSRSAHTSLVDVQLNSTMRLISGTFNSTPLPWLPVLSNIEPPALRRKAATDKLVEKIINECRVILATLGAVSWLTSYGS